jgi:hypothetical protein
MRMSVYRELRESIYLIEGLRRSSEQAKAVLYLDLLRRYA